MRILLLAAGYATRLHPLTLHTPKPLLEIGGRPLLSRLLDRLLSLGRGREARDPVVPSEVVLVTNARFAEAFREWSASESWPVPLTILDDGTQGPEDRLGAVGDLAYALARLPRKPDEGWLVSAADMLLEADLAPAAEAFVRSGAPRLVVRRVPEPTSPSPYNEVTLDGDRVVGFREKPADPRTDRAAIALYFLPASIDERVRAYLGAGGNPDAPGHFIAWLVENERVEASALDGEWHDIGSPETLASARARYAVPDPGSR